MVAIRPQTPGTFVVLVATVLLTIASVSVPVWKSIYLLSADISGASSGVNLSGQIKLGVWGYCIDSTCSPSSLGWTLSSADSLFGISGLAQQAGLSDSVIKWLTYVLILHPIAAGLAGLATVVGIISHLHEFSRGACTAFIASLAGTVALLAFVFDIICFTIAKNRINASQYASNGRLGNAIWITLAGMVLLICSGFFFCIGACIVRKREPRRQASDMTKPVPDAAYAGQMRHDAENAYGGAAPMGAKYGQDRGSLPVFYDKEGEVVPLHSYPDHSDDDFNRGTMPPRQNSQHGSTISGVGYGYGRRTDSPVGSGYNGARMASPPLSPLSSHGPHAHFGEAAMAAGAAGVGAGAGSRLAQEARERRGYQQQQQRQGSSTVEPFVSMSHDGHDTPTSPVAHDYAAGGGGQYGQYGAMPQHDQAYDQNVYGYSSATSHDQHYQQQQSGSTDAAMLQQPAPVRPYGDLKREFYPDLATHDNTGSVAPAGATSTGTPAPSYHSHPYAQQQQQRGQYQNFGDHDLYATSTSPGPHQQSQQQHQSYY